MDSTQTYLTNLLLEIDSICKKYDIEKSIMIANIAGAISVTRLGGRYSMPSLKEVMREYRKCLRK